MIRSALLLTVCAIAGYAQSVNLSGAVTSSSTGAPVAGASVALVNRPLSAVTDTNGYYELVENPTVTPPNAYSSEAGRATVRLTPAAAILTLNAPAERIEVGFYDISGRPWASISHRNLPSGTYSFSLPSRLPVTGLHIVAANINGITVRHRCVSAPGLGNSLLMADLTSSGVAVPKLAKSSAAKAVVDTLTVTKAGYVRRGVPISGYSGRYDIVLDTVLARLMVRVLEDSTFLEIPQANVTVYNATTNEAVARGFSNDVGECMFFLSPGLSCWVRAAAQNYRSNPALHGTAPRFTLGDSGSLVNYDIILKRDSTCPTCGMISGRVITTEAAPLGGALVIAIRQSDSITVTGYAGPDGLYALYNVPRGLYELQGWKAGWSQTAPVRDVPVDSQSVVSGVTITMVPVTGTALSGRVTFLAAPNSEVDVVLAHPISQEAIPGLETMTVSQNYSIASIPPGTYVPWASYYNDGYVMDPDWIRKFGLPVLTVTPTSPPQTINFSVTGAIRIISPTNAPDTLEPVSIDTDIPTFVWAPYPSTQEFIIAVYDNFGDIIWGGYDSRDSILHPRILGSQTSVVFNFDGSAREPLRPGRQYRWKVWADKGQQPGVQQLISSSEDLMGMFMIADF